jgi:hypothetical protein
MTSTYWLSEWLDENEIHAEWEIDHVLHSGIHIRRLFEFIVQKAHDPQSLPSNVGDSIVAGTKVDLSGSLGCCALECLRNTIDCGFKNLWHYFDKIIVQGLDARRVVIENEGPLSGERLSALLQSIIDQAKLVLYLRSIGAEDFVVFANKPHMFCEDHWREHARELGIEAVLDEKQQTTLISRIIRSSKIEIEKLDDELWHASVSSPFFGGTSDLLIPAAKRPSKHSVAFGLLGDYATAMIADVALAREMMLPLVEQTDASWIAKASQKRSPLTEKDVILEINFPVFDELSTADFLKLRSDEQPYFERFRASLRQAIAAEITGANADKPAAQIAATIENDYLRPGLADIERQVRGNRIALIKKGAISLAIGGSVAAIGAISSVPLMIVGGVGALGTSVPLAPLIYQYIDARNVAIPMSDLYFLWRIGNSRHHR